MAVTLGTAMLGCAPTVSAPAGQGDGGATSNGGGAQSTVGPSSSTSTAGGAGNGGADPGSGGSAVSSTDATGGAAPTKCGPLIKHWKAYEKCCEAVNWDYQQGCEAWGPPMPPSMAWIAKEVA